MIALLLAILTNRYEGIRKPEQLKHKLWGFWSIKINKEHRLVYEALEDKEQILIHSVRGHY